MTDTKQKRHRIFVVGGKGRNIPPWISAAFDCEQFVQDQSKTRTLEPQEKPDAIVILSSWIGHEHFYGARDLAEQLDIPLIISPGGWSASLKSAAELGVEWFIADIEKSKTNSVLTKEQTTEVEEVVDNAWREAYTREWTAHKALSRRFLKLQTKLENTLEELEKLRVKDAAAQRVIEEIRAAAAKQRENTRTELLPVTVLRSKELQLNNTITQIMTTMTGLSEFTTQIIEKVKSIAPQDEHKTSDH